MTASKDHAERATAALAKLLRPGDETGAPLEVVGSWSDISARKAAEEAEDAAQVRLSVLLETAPSVIYSFRVRNDYTNRLPTQGMRPV